MDKQDKNISVKIIRLPQVMEMTGLSRSTLYKWIKEHRFPAQVALGTNSIGFVEAEVKEWLADKVRSNR